MKYKETERMELKATLVDGIKKEIIAFANTQGGKLILGVEDDGEVCGLEDPDGVALAISNMVRDNIKPDVSMFLHYETIVESGKSILKVEVQRGTDRPYYLARKGMRPEGVYVRQGYSAVPASDTAIRKMIKETDGDVFETTRSLEQELTFDALEREFVERGMELGTAQMRSLKLIDKDGLYSNTALLLSDQCPYTTKLAIFQGTTPEIFRDRKEFSGSLMKQMNEIYHYLDYRNQIRSTIEGLRRCDVRDYPDVALRETILNQLIHRDYSVRASALIKMYDDKIEFISFGRLLEGVELDDIMSGVSACRNQQLADVFHRLELIEAFGTGMRKIMGSYSGRDVEPLIGLTTNTFKMTLPNINFVAERKSRAEIREQAMLRDKLAEAGEWAPTSMHVSYVKDIAELGVNESKVLGYLRENGSIGRAETEELLGVSSATASRLLSRMTGLELLQVHGKARATRYTEKF